MAYGKKNKLLKLAILKAQNSKNQKVNCPVKQVEQSPRGFPSQLGNLPSNRPYQFRISSYKRILQNTWPTIEQQKATMDQKTNDNKKSNMVMEDLKVLNS